MHLGQWYFFCLTISLTPSSVLAEQLSFSEQKLAGFHQYHYQWRDADNNVKTLTFQLDVAATELIPYSQPAYKSEQVARHLRFGLLEKAQQIDPRLARIDIRQHRNEVIIEVKGKDSQQVKNIQDQLIAQRDEINQAYLTAHMYRKHIDVSGETGVTPDYAAHALQQTAALIPLSQAFYEMLPERSDARAYINLLLSWVQSIPYDTLEDRASSFGSGFLPPIAVIDQNKGDCDSKSVLTAALIRAFLPQVPMGMVLLHEHAILAISLPALRSDKTLQHEQKNWVLFDPTGPALMVFGQISDETLIAINNQQYQLLSIPPLSTQ